MPPHAISHKPVSVRQRALEAAADCVLRDRNVTHGEPEDNLSDIAKGWTVIVGCDISATQVALMMVWLKTVRANENPAHWDSWIDIAGYASIGAEVSDSHSPGSAKPPPGAV